MNWESDNSLDLQQRLASVMGCPQQWQHDYRELNVSTAIQALGICSRLQCGVPVLFVGDWGRNTDVMVATLVSEMLRPTAEASVELEVVDVKNGTEVDVDAFNLAHAGDPPLLLMRCGKEALHPETGVGPLTLLHSVLIERRSGLALGSLHYENTSALHLQLQLPAPLRDAVVFFGNET
jgi:hypothetical protein